MEINTWVHRVHTLAVERGWHLASESERLEKGSVSPERMLAWMMLVVSEVAEACEEIRDDKPYIYQTGHHQIEGNYQVLPGSSDWSDSRKPEGVRSEFADVVIRVMDIYGFMGWDLEADILQKHTFNVKRAFKHGNKVI